MAHFKKIICLLKFSNKEGSVNLFQDLKWVRWTSKSDLSSKQSVTKVIYLVLTNLVTPKARAKHEPFVQRTGHWSWHWEFQFQFLSRFFKIRLGLYNKKFQKCLINYLGLSHEQTVTSQLYLLVNHLRDHSSLLWSLWYSWEVLV